MENFGTDLISREVLSKFKIKILSINSLDITDEVYFSDKYSNYISNSKLKLINPNEGGSFKTYLEGLKSKSTGSLDLGSAVHELILQNESFELNSYTKLSGKIGKVIEVVFKYRNKGYSILNAIRKASEEVSYYVSQLTNTRISNIISSGFKYYLYLYKNKDVKYDKEQIILDEKSRETCIKCVDSIRRNSDATNLLSPDEFSLDQYLNKNEDTIIIEILVTFPNSLNNSNAPIVEIPLKLKAKIDNWNLNIDEGVLNLNDLKTTGKMWYMFPGSTINETGEFVEGSFQHYHYYRQLGMYYWMLLSYLNSENYVVSKSYLNIISVQTIPNYSTVVFRIPNKWFVKGLKEFKTLLSYAAYAEYNKEKILS